MPIDDSVREMVVIASKIFSANTRKFYGAYLGFCPDNHDSPVIYFLIPGQNDFGIESALAELEINILASTGKEIPVRRLKLNAEEAKTCEYLTECLK